MTLYSHLTRIQKADHRIGVFFLNSRTHGGGGRWTVGRSVGDWDGDEPLFFFPFRDGGGAAATRQFEKTQGFGCIRGYDWLLVFYAFGGQGWQLGFVERVSGTYLQVARDINTDSGASVIHVKWKTDCFLLGSSAEPSRVKPK